MTNSVPVANLGLSYVNGLELSWASTTTLTVAAGQCRDSSNVFDLVLGASTVLNGAVVGSVNGLDTGALANSTLYYVFVIADSTKYRPTGLLLSASETAPTMPAGYDILRRIGYARTDGSARILKFYQCGNAGMRKYVLDVPLSVLSGGSSATFAAVDLSTAIPAIRNCLVGLQVSYTPAIAANAATIRPSGSASTAAVDISGVVAAKAQLMQVEAMSLLISGVPKVDYKVTASDALSLSVISFVDFL